MRRRTRTTHTNCYNKQSRGPQHDMLLIIVNMNAKVWADNTDCEQAMGAHRCDNGKHLIDFCLNNCVIGGTTFPHKKVHKLIWKLPDGHTVNHIEHINNKWRRSRQDVRTRCGADASSDYYIVVANIKLKLWKTNTESRQKIFRNCQTKVSRQ